MDQSNENVDIAVIGAGISGLYAAYRIASSFEGIDRKRPSLAVYDATERVGGRLLSLDIPGAPFTADAGAMRFISNQVFVASLVKELHLKAEPFLFADRGFLLRGKALSMDDVLSNRAPESTPCSACGRVDQPKVPYGLEGSESGILPASMIVRAIGSALSHTVIESGAEVDTDFVGTAVATVQNKLERLRELDMDALQVRLATITPREWMMIRKYGNYRNRLLWRVGFWDVLLQELSTEAYAFAHDGMGYESIMSNWNAAEAIPWFLSDFFTPADEYLRIHDGMESLPERLRDRLLPHAAVHLYSTLLRIRAATSGEDLLTLDFVDSSPGKTPRHFTQRAKQVILAIPQGAIRGVDYSGFPEHERSAFAALVERVTGHQLFKLFLAYDNAWWVDTRIWNCGNAGSPLPVDAGSSGRVFTDLLLRQVYYYGPDKQSDDNRSAGPQSQRAAMLMASYSDSHYVEFWRALGADRGPNAGWWGASHLVLTEKEKLRLRTYGASEAIVKCAHQQLRHLHGLKEDDPTIPQVPKAALYKDWSDPPFYAGWHTWRVGIPAWQTRREIEKPFRNAEVYVCGESYSSEQGWCEGALRSTERVLHRLGLPSPQWISEDEYMKRRGFENYKQYIEF